MDVSPHPKFILAKDVTEALSALQRLGDKAIPVAGATWVMRAPIRQEKADLIFVDLSHIEALRAISVDDHEVVIGALATQENIANALYAHKDMAALAVAAGHTANPAIRRMATIGGNICTTSFAASDLVPALLALDARIETQSIGSTRVSPIIAFLAGRDTRPHTDLVTRIFIPRAQKSSAHVRLTLRKAGDYPVANLSVAITLNANGEIDTAAAALGSVEPVARRWTEFETAIVGRKPIPSDMQDIAASHTDKFSGRDTPGTPGWYRLRVIPNLVSKAFKILQQS